jgi:uncharacterized delta-60 repeat protein
MRHHRLGAIFLALQWAACACGALVSCGGSSSSTSAPRLGADASDGRATENDASDSDVGAVDPVRDASPALDAGLADAALDAALSDAGADTAVPSKLDPTFGDGGALSLPWTQFNDSGAYLSVHAIQARADGRLVISGTNGLSPMVAQALADGTGLDPTFGVSGVVVLPSIIGATSLVEANDAVLALQSDGKILVGHMCSAPVYRSGHEDMCVTRLLAEGKPDTTFGDSVSDGSTERTGTAHMSTGGSESDAVGAITLDSHGRVLFVGNADDTTALVGRLDGNGVFDHSFNGGALGRFDFNGPTNNHRNHPLAIVTQSTGRIVIGSGGGSGPNDSDNFVVAAFTEEGLLDGSFGIATGSIVGGTVAVALPHRAELRGMLLGTNDTILLAGSSTTATDDGGVIDTFTAARLSAAGKPDTSFGAGGITTVQSPSGAAVMKVTGVVSIGTFSYAGVSTVDLQGMPTECVLKLTSAGVSDATYGTGGYASAVARTDMSAIGVQNGKVVTGGVVYTGAAHGVLIERLVP